MSRFESVQHRNIFKKTLLDMAKHNLEAQNGIKTWTQGVNEFVDMTDAEASVFVSGFPEGPSARSNVSHVSLKQFRDISWKDSATPVKNQGQCGSCYAFGAVGLSEHQYSINNGVKLDLSEQQVVDCDTKAKGCDGGDASWTLKFLKNGVALESDYPYQAKAKACGNPPPAGPVVKEITKGKTEGELVDFLNQGPVMINAKLDKAFQLYKGGIVQECAGPVIGAHSMNVVGMGTENNSTTMSRTAGERRKGRPATGEWRLV